MTRLLSAWDNRVIDQHGVTHLMNPPCWTRTRDRAEPVVLYRLTDERVLTCLWCAARWEQS